MVERNGKDKMTPGGGKKQHCLVWEDFKNLADFSFGFIYPHFVWGWSTGWIKFMELGMEASCHTEHLWDRSFNSKFQKDSFLALP